MQKSLPYSKRTRSDSLNVESESNYKEKDKEPLDMDSLILSINELNNTNKVECNKIEGMLNIINSKLNKLNDIDKLEIMIKKVEKKFESVIREKDYEISNLKDEMDSLKYQVNEDISNSNILDDYFT